MSYQRCKKNNHYTFTYYANKNVDNKPLPPTPEKKVSFIKRKNNFKNIGPKKRGKIINAFKETNTGNPFVTQIDNLDSDF